MKVTPRPPPQVQTVKIGKVKPPKSSQKVKVGKVKPNPRPLFHVKLLKGKVGKV